MNFSSVWLLSADFYTALILYRFSRKQQKVVVWEDIYSIKLRYVDIGVLIAVMCFLSRVTFNAYKFLCFVGRSFALFQGHTFMFSRTYIEFDKKAKFWEVTRHLQGRTDGQRPINSLLFIVELKNDFRNRVTIISD